MCIGNATAVVLSLILTTSVLPGAGLAQEPLAEVERRLIDSLEATGGTVSFTDGLRARAFVRADLASPAGDGTPVALSLGVEDPMRLQYQRVQFFPLPSTSGGNHWVAVGRMTIHPADDFRVRTVFADAASCPLMIDMLALAEQLKTPIIDLPDVPSGTGPIRARVEQYAPQGAVHGLEYELSARSFFYDTDTRARSLIAGSDNTPVGAWARATLAALEPCWSTNPIAA